MSATKLFVASIICIASAVLHAQAITSITPDTAQQGESLTVAITGQDTHFAQGSTTVWLSNGSSDIFAQGSPTTFGQGSSTIDDTLLAVHFDIDPNTQAGSWDVNVQNDTDGVLTLSDGFTVTPTIPMLTSVVPANAQQDQSLSVTITGQDTHFAQGSTTVWLSKDGTDIFAQGTPTIFGQGSPTSFGQGSCTIDDTFLSAHFDIPPDALTDSWDVNVQTAIDGILTLLEGLVIDASSGSVAAITSITPDTAQQGESLTVAITGQDTHFAQGSTTVWLSNGSSDIFAQGSPTTFGQGSSTIDDTLLAVHFDIDPNTQAGSWDVNVQNDTDGVLTLSDGFTVTPTIPMLTSVVPANAQQDQSLSVTITGQDTHFAQGSTTVWLSKDGTDIFAQGTPTIFGQGSPTSFGQGSCTIDDTFLSAHFDIPPDALTGSWDVNVESSGEDILSLIDEFTITSQTATLSVTSPISSDRWAKGQTYDIKWSTDNPSPNVKILLFKGDSKVLTIKNPTPNDDIHPWKIPTSLSKGVNYRIKIICVDDTAVFAFSDVFEIVGACDLFTPIEVSEPNDNTEWEMGEDYSIEWSGGEIEQNVKILLYKGSDKKRTITVSTPNDGEYDYTIPYDLPPGSNYKIQVKVLDSSCSSLVDMSDDFEISIPPVEVSEPDNSTTWMMGDTDVEINWSGFPPGDVNIKLFKGSDAVKTISDGTLNNGSYKWATVPYSLKPGLNYRVRVTSKVNKKINTFSDYFSIQIPPINVVDPNSSTEWKRGHVHPIQWTGGKPGKYVKIKLLDKDGVPIKTIKSETKNDGLYNWTVPTGLELESDYSVEVIYKPDTSMRDSSDLFTVINSPVGSWVGVWDDAPDSGPLKLVIKNNDTVEGYFKSDGIKFPFSGTYSYDYATGGFLSSLSGIKKIDGRPKYRITLVTAGTCVNHTMTGSYSGDIEIKKNDVWQPLEDLDGTFTVNR